MNILIPMAGEGSRFKIAGFKKPKPLIDIYGKPMIQWAIDSLNLSGNKIFVINSKHKEFGLDCLLKDLYPKCKVIEVNKITEGAACTCLLAKKIINNDEELVIANCDQISRWDSKKFLEFVKNNYDGVVITFNSTSPYNSYVKLNSKGEALLFAEKKVISNNALTGICYWKKGSDFVYSAERMIEENDRTNNEFFVSPTYNYLIMKRKKIVAYEVTDKEHIPIGIPYDLYLFLNNRQISNENF